MTLVAVTMVRDEQDVIRHTLDHLLAEGVDRIVVADNLSTDDTRHILATYEIDHPERVVVLEDDEPGHYQDRKMTELARYAAKHCDATWVLPFDADEVWYSPHGTLAEFFASLPSEAALIVGTGWDHIVTDDDDPTVTNPYRRITHRRIRPQKLPKVAFRWQPDAWIDHGNHNVFNVAGTKERGLEYRHFQYRSFEQMCQKVRQGKEAMEAADLHPTYGAHWRELGALNDSDLFRKWRRLCEEPGLTEDPAPVR